MPKRYLAAADARRLRTLLKAPHEYVGRVDVRSDGRMVFDHARKRSPGAGLTFHTHNRAACSGGFDPPSRQDLRHLCKWARTGHYVVSHNGVYFVRISCRVPKARVEAVCKQITGLQKRLGPGGAYNAAWMRAANSLAPGCLHVKFISWSKL
jgi:hypothetical protein